MFCCGVSVADFYLLFAICNVILIDVATILDFSKRIKKFFHRPKILSDLQTKSHKSYLLAF